MAEPTQTQKWLVTALLFCSGATALVYEVVWGKWLGNVLGNSGQAHAVVLAAFLGGLALGAWLFGKRADTLERPLALYGWLELGIALYALAFPFVLKALGALYLVVAAGLPEGARLIPKLVLAGLSIIPPTLLMGGTLVPVVRHFTAHLSGLRDELARLYALNALGAATGALVGGMVLLPALGLTGSTRAAAALNLAVAVTALVLAKRTPSAASGARAEPATTDPEPDYGTRGFRAARTGAALSGFTSMVLQLTWIRLLTLVLGASTYAFTLIVTGFILGIGVGSLLLRRVRERDGLAVFGFAQLLLAVAVAAGIPLYQRLTWWIWVLNTSMQHSADTWASYQTLSFLMCSTVLLIPTTLLGASFPAVARVGTAQVSALGRQLGGVYLWNTLGTLAGALLTGLWLLPLISMEWCVGLAIFTSLAAAFVALRAAPSRVQSPQRTQAALAVGAVLAVFFFQATLRWSELVGNAGTFRELGAAPQQFESYRKGYLASDTLLLYRDDTFATVVVGDNKHNKSRYLRINGKVDASDGDDMSTQVLLGQLGPLLHSGEPKTALVIGLGSGITVGSLLTHGFQRVDVVEISPAVVDAAKLFFGVNRDALSDPRVHVHIDDARTFMLLEGRKYDVVVSEPSNPWVAGVAGLFTREFFQLVKDHLAPGGLLVQWQHLYETDDEMVQLIVRTLRDTFPHGTSWLGGVDLLMVAGMDEVRPDPEKLEARLKSWTVGADLGRIEVASVAALLALQVHSEAGQVDYAGPGPINTEDQNRLEYGAPIAFYLRNPRVVPRDERVDSAGVTRLALHAWEKTTPRTATTAAEIYTAVRHSTGPDDMVVIDAAAEWQRLAPKDPMARFAVAGTAYAQGDVQRAVDLLGELVAEGARTPKVVGRWAEAGLALEDKTGTRWAGRSSVLSVLKAELDNQPDAPEFLAVLAVLCKGEESTEACLDKVEAAAPPAVGEEDEAPAQPDPSLERSPLVP